jgi:hypothetical protein
MNLLDHAKRLREIIEGAMTSVDDKTASESAELFPRLTYDGSLIKSGTRICWNGIVKRASVDLWDTAENAPDKAPTLWEDIEYRDGYRLIPEVITAGTAFAKDECGWWGNDLYRSLLDGNVWTPEAYPSGWELVSET